LSLHIDVDSLIAGFYDEQLLKQKENLSILQKDFKQFIELGFLPSGNNLNNCSIIFSRSSDKKKIIYFFGSKIPASLVISLLDEMTHPIAIERAEKARASKVVS
jgi:hypothetical protein